jgi:hypothetical protein
MRTTLTFVTALCVVAMAAPSASARPIDSDSAQASPPRPTVTRTVDEGIDLGSAALGAGGASALLMLTAAGAITVMHRRRHDGPGPTAAG